MMYKIYNKFKHSLLKAKAFLIVIDKSNITFLADAITFNLIFYLVPMLSLGLTIMAHLNVLFNLSIDNSIYRFLDDLLPDSLNENFSKYILDFSEKTRRMTGFTFAIFVSSTFLLIFNIERVFMRILNVEQYPPLHNRILRYIVVSIFMPVILILILFFAHSVHNFFISKIANILLLQLMFYSLYRSFIYKQIKNSTILKLSILPTVSLIVINHVFSGYLFLFNNYRIIYGVFSAIPIFLIWAYLMVLNLLVWLTILNKKKLINSLKI